MQSDTGWSNRGRTAYHGSLPIIWHEKQLIVLHVVLSKDIESDGEVKKAGNYEGSSGGMEGTALKQVLRELHTRQLLQKCSNIVMDKDSTSTSIINQLAICQHITIRYDPGHAKKSFVNQLLKVRLFSLSLARLSSPLLSSPLSLSVCVSLCLSVSLSRYLYLSISLSLCLSVSVSLPLWLSIYLSISRSLCLDVSMSLSVSISPTLFSLCFHNLTRHYGQVFVVGSTLEGLALRMGRWFMSLVKHCENEHKGDIDAMQTEFLRLWKYTIPHYQVSPCLPGCPCAFLHDELKVDNDDDNGLFSDLKLPELPVLEVKTQSSAKIASGRLYLDKTFAQHARALKGMQIICDHIRDKVKHYLHGYNTCFAESMHNKRCKWTNKRKFYMYFEVAI